MKKLIATRNNWVLHGFFLNPVPVPSPSQIYMDRNDLVPTDGTDGGAAVMTDGTDGGAAVITDEHVGDVPVAPDGTVSENPLTVTQKVGDINDPPTTVDVDLVEVFSGVGEGVETGVETVGKAARTVANGLSEGATNLGETVSNAAGTVASGLSEGATNLGKTAGNAAGTVVSGLSDVKPELDGDCCEGDCCAIISACCEAITKMVGCCSCS